MRAVGYLVATAFAAAVAIAPAVAPAAITVTPGADTVSTPRLELDFADAAGNVERLDSLRWRDTTGLLGSNLVANGGAGGCPDGLPDMWGAANSVAGLPAPVGDGTTGTWTARGQRSVEILSSRPTLCSADSVVTPVRTRYTFFNVGDAAGKVRVERTISFSGANPAYATPSMRAYVPRLPLGSHSEVLHPNAAGNALIAEPSTNPAQVAASWNQTWLAINNPATDAGVLILRETNNPARLMLENNGAANSSSVDLLKPGGGWTAPVTETEWLCPYDNVSWPPAGRLNTLPAGCSIVAVPFNTATPQISGEPKITSTLTGDPGSWDRAASLAFQWFRCTGGACASIPGETGATHTLVLADEGKQLRFAVTATAAGGEEDTAISPLTGVVQPGPPQNTSPPTVAGEARQGETLTGTAGGWSASPTSYEFQWLRCATAAGTSCTDVPGATQATYKLGRDDVGATMRLRVRAVNAVGASEPAVSGQTGEVQREVIRARLAISPSPSCTAVGVNFDGGASSTPNGPIKRYRITYKVMPTPVLIGIIFGTAFGGSDDATPAINAYLATQPAISLYDGPKPAAPRTGFTWNRQLTKAEITGGKAGDWARDPIYATLTVTDAAGASASTLPQLLSFNQVYSSQSRTSCPHVRVRTVPDFAFEKIRALAAVTEKAFTAKVPCKAIIDCAGSLTAVKVTHRAPKAGGTVLASNPFFSVPGEATAKVRAKLTEAGRALVKRGKPIDAIVKLTSINPLTGKKTTHSSRVSLPGR